MVHGDNRGLKPAQNRPIQVVIAHRPQEPEMVLDKPPATPCWQNQHLDAKNISRL